MLSGRLPRLGDRFRRTARADEGSTLVEALVAVVILGVAVVGLLSAMATLVSTSGRHREQSRAATVLAAAAEAVSDPARNAYVDCAAPAAYLPTSGVSLPAGWSAANVNVTAVRYWGGAAFGATCHDATIGAPARLQEIDLRAESPDGRGTLSVTVVKRGD